MNPVNPQYPRDTPIIPKGALRRAYVQSKALMKRPVALSAWVVIGVMVAIEQAAQGPAGLGYALASDARDFVALRVPMNDDLMAVSALIMEQSGMFILVTLPLLLFFFFVTVFLLWLGSRMQMAFLSAASAGDYRMGRHWNGSSEDGQSLFLFRLTLAVLSFLTLVVLILIGSLFVGEASERGQGLPAAFRPAVLFLSWGGLLMGLLNAVLRNLCAPIMLLRRVTCLDALWILGGIARRYPGPLLAYAGIRTAWLGAVWGLWVVGGVGTCFVGLLPGVHHALFAPLYLFDRLFSLYLIESVLPGQTAPEAPDPAAESWRAALSAASPARGGEPES